jgi:hypothetical protein
MDQTQTFQEFPAAKSVQIPLPSFGANLILATIQAFILPLDETEKVVEELLLVEFRDYPQRPTTRAGLLKLGDLVKINLLENRGIGRL